MTTRTYEPDPLAAIGYALTARYRDLSAPWYGWVLPAYQAGPYRAVVDDLSARGAKVSDETDLNDDVSCRYYVSRDGVFLIVEVSLVGPYAVVMDTEARRDGPITAAMPDSDLARDVLTALAAHGLHMLDADTVRTPLDMPFQNVEAGQGTLYQALFSDTPTPFGVDVRRADDSAPSSSDRVGRSRPLDA